jgi:glucosyl-3-phosphoglycerate phosphatase
LNFLASATPYCHSCLTSITFDSNPCSADGQSTHNAQIYPDLNDALYLDADLSSVGVAQAKAVSAAITALNPDMVVSSPMTRAINTCLHACAGLSAATRDHMTINADCGERLAYACDIGSPVSVLSARFPSLDFGGVPRPEAWWWTPGGSVTPAGERGPCEALARLRQGAPGSGAGAEPDWALKTRVDRFRRWLVEQDARKIVVFAHGMFLARLAASGGAKSKAQKEGRGNWLENCEIVTMHL